MRNLFLLTVIATMGVSAAWAGELPFVCVFDFEAGGDVDAETARELAERVRAGIGEVGVYEEFDRRAAIDLLKPRGIDFAECRDAACGRKAGDILAVSNIVVGKLAARGNKFSLSLSLLDVGSGAELKKVGRTCDCPPAEWPNIAQSASMELARIDEPATAPAEREDAETGSIYVRTDPTGAKIFLDGEELAGAAPLAIPNVSPGLHRLVARGENGMATAEVQVVKGKNTNAQLSLTDQITGSISVDSFPQDLTVKVDDVVYGKTPLIIPNVPIGKHRIEIKHIDFVLYQKTITVYAGETTEVYGSILKPEWHLLGVGLQVGGSFNDFQMVGVSPTLRIANPVALGLKFSTMLSKPSQNLRFAADTVPADSVVHQGQTDSYQIQLTKYDSIGLLYRYSPVYEFHKFDLSMGLFAEYWMVEYELTHGIPQITSDRTGGGELNGIRFGGDIVFDYYFVDWLSGFFGASVGIATITLKQTTVEFQDNYKFEPDDDIDLNQVRIGFGVAAHFF